MEMKTICQRGVAAHGIEMEWSSRLEETEKLMGCGEFERDHEDFLRRSRTQPRMPGKEGYEECGDQPRSPREEGAGQLEHCECGAESEENRKKAGRKK